MASRPNLLFIMPDQLRHDFLSCYGADFIDTPHIDSLAQHGVRYQNAYSPAPICVPARSMLMTGRNPIKTGVLSNNYFLRPDEGACGIRSWPELLVEAGYATAAIGKMHFYPWDLDMGFEHRVVCEDATLRRVVSASFTATSTRAIKKTGARLSAAMPRRTRGMVLLAGPHASISATTTKISRLP
jgi:arylsulfatase A-like enzyme